jgi:hypothetical protein
MPRKATKRARTVERDWRATLFVWRGDLEAGTLPTLGPQLEWRGAWLGTDDDTMPSAAALRRSPNTFELETEPFDEESIYEKGKASLLGTEFEGGECGGSGEIFEGIEMILGGADEDDPEGRKAFFLLDGLFEMTLTGSYKLDTEDVSDDTHRWEVRTHPKTSPGEMDASTHAAVAAVGTTPFGRFISLGLIDGSTMTLARRYIADDDPRAAWASPAAVLDAVLGDGPLALANIPAKLPWKVGA